MKGHCTPRHPCPSTSLLALALDHFPAPTPPIPLTAPPCPAPRPPFPTSAVKPPPEPTAEAVADLEALIRRRIGDHRFDDPIRIAPPAAEVTKKEVTMDDNKAAKVRGGT